MINSLKELYIVHSQHFIESTDVTLDQFPLTKVNAEENCDGTGFSDEDCQILYQPCYYNVTVATVYKGSLMVSSPLTASIISSHWCI